MKRLFGYIVPYKPELKMREFDVFQGYYCGLCKTLHQQYGLRTRLSLNYDLTFLALLLDSLNTEQASVTREGCILNPIKKKPVRKTTKSLKYCAALSIIVGMLKLQDDWQDEKSQKAFVGKIMLQKAYRRAGSSVSDKFECMQNKMQQLHQLELAQAPGLDQAASVFADMMSEFFTPVDIKDDKSRRILAWLGYNLGRWVYLLDAFDDIEKDIATGNYNVLLLHYDYLTRETPSAFRSRISAEMQNHLTYTLAEAARTFELLDLKCNTGLLENIIYLGTRHRMQQIFNRGDESNEKSL